MIEMVKKFYDELASNVERQNELSELRKKYDTKNFTPEETKNFLMNELIPFAKNYGFEFSYDELIEYGLKADRKKTLNQEDLE